MQRNVVLNQLQILEYSETRSLVVYVRILFYYSPYFFTMLFNAGLYTLQLNFASPIHFDVLDHIHKNEC